MNTTFEYDIQEYNAETKTLKVQYQDGSWALISLLEPLPKNIEELSAIVAQYTSPMEHEIAIVDDVTDLSYISNSIGQTITTERRWLNPNNKPSDELAASEIDDMIETVLGRSATTNQQTSTRTLELAFAKYQQYAAVLTPDISERLTPENLQLHREYCDALCEIMVLAQQAIQDDVEYTAIMPDYSLQFKVA